MSTELVKHGALSGASLPDMVRYAEHLSDAGLLPAQYRKQPANVLYAMEYGRTLGITPIAAITGIHVIEGKPSASAALIGGLVRQAGHKLRVTGNAQRATAQIVRADDPDFVFEVTWELRRNDRGNPNAEEAKLLNKDVWQKYAASMLKSRAISQVARDACEEVLFGLHYTPEELDVNVDADGNPVNAPVQQLRRVQPGEADPWEAPQPRAQGSVVVDPECIQPHPNGQAIVEAAAAATRKEDVKQRWAEAKAAEVLNALIKAPDSGKFEMVREYLTRLGKAVPENAPAHEGIVDVEVVDEVAEAEQQLRATAAKVGLDTLDQDFAQSYGITIAEAGVDQLAEMNQLLGGAA